MSGREARGGLAEALRRQFDAAFAAPLRAGRDVRVALLAIRVGGEPAALRVLELSGLVQARPVVPVPSRRPELLGVSGLRGAIVPVYSLARLLGRADDPAPAWIALADGGAVGFAVAALDAHLLVAPDSLAALAAGDGARPHVRALLRREAGPLPVLDVPSLVRAITQE